MDDLCVHVDSDELTTSYYTFLKLAVIIYFAIIRIMSLPGGGGWVEEGHKPLSLFQPRAHLTASVHTEQKCSRMLFCSLISHVANWFYVRGFRDQLNATEELHFSLIISLRTPFQCSQCNVSFLYKKSF